MDEREHPTTEQPLNAPEPRRRLPSVLALVALLVVVAAIFALLTYLQQNT